MKDHTFDFVVRIFVATFAPKPIDVAKEIVRVTRPRIRKLQKRKAEPVDMHV